MPAFPRSGMMRSALTAFFALSVITSSHAKPTLELRSGFDGNYRPNTWTPLQVRIINPGANTGARLQVSVRTVEGSTRTYAQPIRLRAGSGEQQQTVYYYHPDFSQRPEVTAQLLIDGRTAAEKKLENALPIRDEQPAVLGLTQDLSGLNFLSQIDLGYQHRGSSDPMRQYRGGRGSSGSSPGMSPGTTGGLGNQRTPTRVIYPRPATLPDNPFVYDAVDAVVLGDLPLDLLTEGQWNAITEWVKDGGILLISGGADINRMRSRMLADLLPINPSRVETVNALPSLKYMYDSEPKLKGSPIIVGSLKGDTVAFVRRGDTPIVSARRLGSGLVVFTAFDLLAPEFRSWPGQENLWRQIMQRGARETRLTEVVKAANQPYTGRQWGGGGYYSGNNRALSDALAGIQSTEAPSFTFIGGFLLLYILCLVPLNYYLLKKRDRKELAWITAPVIIVLFSTGAYAVGYRIKGGQLYLNSCSVLEGAANTDGFQAYTVASVFSPRQARYDLSIADPNALPTEVTEGMTAFQRAAGDILIERDQKTIIKNALVNMWDHRTYDFESHANIGGAVAASVQPGRNMTCTVQITNTTGRPIMDASVSFRGNSMLLGALQPGESKTASLNYRNNTLSGVSIVTGGMASVSPTAARIQESLAGMAQSAQAVSPTGESQAPFVFTGWFAGPASGVALENEQPKQHAVNLLVVHLPAPEGVGLSMPRVTMPPPNFRNNPFAGALPGGGPTFPGPVRTPAAAYRLNSDAYGYANNGRLDLALKAAQDALKLAPQNGSILDTVGEMHQRRKEYKQAAVYYAQALRRMPSYSPETHEKYGETLLALGRRQEAITQLQAAARDTGQWGMKARAALNGLGIPAGTGSGMMGVPVTPRPPSFTGGAPTNLPPVPQTGKGSRRFVRPGPGGGSYVIIQRWDHTSGASSSSTSQTYIPPGQPLPRQ
jgi:hypothetical protein